ncbi:hypothetical protein NDU88_006637 [Pleurodeles waltl]|uniref:Uncharacterized protein n=1 Tax=Pleurodeles waltl TaxID=8319 RepID=A0AAV7ULK3_PLEWA|nr:hypothetical protein NDU88_006637 [Pleurodeles waltl]
MMGKIRAAKGKPQGAIAGEETLTATKEVGAFLAMHMATILEPIRSTKETLGGQIAAAVNEVGLLHEDRKKLVERTKETETQ